MTNWHSRQHLELLIAVQSTQLPELLTRQQFSATAHGLNSGKRNSPLARDAQFDQTGLTLGTQHLRCKSVLENEMHLGVTLASDSRISTRSACTGLHFRFMHLGGGRISIVALPAAGFPMGRFMTSHMTSCDSDCTSNYDPHDTRNILSLKEVT